MKTAKKTAHWDIFYEFLNLASHKRHFNANYMTSPFSRAFNRSGHPLHQSYIDTFVAILPEIKGWRSTVDAETQAEQNDRWLDESVDLLTTEEIAALKQ